uniref:Uncharacterized protein n=1 Tax=Tetraselmis sp. GSL018 TaxID=582737 RepID=A0A061QQS4_9CHLO
MQIECCGTQSAKSAVQLHPCRLTNGQSQSCGERR